MFTQLQAATFVLAAALMPTQPANAFLFSSGSSGAATGDHAQLIAQLINAFRADHPTVQITLKATTSYVAPVVESLMYEGGEGIPDVAVVGIPQSPILLEKKRLNPITMFLRDDDIAELRRVFRKDLDVEYYGTNANSRDYLLPFNRSNVVLYVNTGLLDLKSPTVTFVELADLLERRWQAYPAQRSKLKLTLPLDEWNIETLFVSARGRATIEGNDVRLNDGPAREVIEAIRKLKRKGLLELVFTQGRGYHDFLNGSTASALLTMSCYSSVVEHGKVPFKIMMPPQMKKNIAIIGGGDLLFPKTTAGMSPQTASDVRTFVRWYYLDRGAALWAQLVGYHPVTTSALASKSFQAALARRPQDREVYVNSKKWERQSFYRLDRYCFVVEIRKLFQNSLKDILEAEDLDAAIALAQANLTELVRRPCP